MYNVTEHHTTCHSIFIDSWLVSTIAPINSPHRVKCLHSVHTPPDTSKHMTAPTKPYTNSCWALTQPDLSNYLYRPVELIRTTEALTARRDADALSHPSSVVARPASGTEPRPPSKRRALSAQTGKHDRRRTSGYSSDSSSPSPSGRRTNSARHQRKPPSVPSALQHGFGSAPHFGHPKQATRPHHNPYARLLHSAAAHLQGQRVSSSIGKVSSSQGNEQGDVEGWDGEEGATQDTAEEGSQGSQGLHRFHGLHADGRGRTNAPSAGTWAASVGGSAGRVPSFLAAHRQRLQQSTDVRSATAPLHNRLPGGAAGKPVSADRHSPLHQRPHGVTKPAPRGGARGQRCGAVGSDEDYEMSEGADRQGVGRGGGASDSSGDWGGPLLSRARQHGWTRPGLRHDGQQEVRPRL